MHLPTLDPNSVFEASQGNALGLVAGTPGLLSLSSAIFCDHCCSLALCKQTCLSLTQPLEP